MQQILDEFREIRNGGVVTAGLYVERAVNLGYVQKYPVYTIPRNDVVQSRLVDPTGALGSQVFSPDTKLTWDDYTDFLNPRDLRNHLLNMTLKQVTPQGQARLNLRDQPVWGRYVTYLQPVVNATVLAYWAEVPFPKTPAVTVREYPAVDRSLFKPLPIRVADLNWVPGEITDSGRLLYNALRW